MRTKTQKHKNNNKIIFDTHVHNTHTYMCIVNLIPFLEYNITCARYYEILYKQLIVVLVLQQMEGNNIFEILSKKAIEKRRVSVREMRGVSVREMRGDGRIKPRRHCDYVSECYTYFSLCCLQRCFVLTTNQFIYTSYIIWCRWYSLCHSNYTYDSSRINHVWHFLLEWITQIYPLYLPFFLFSNFCLMRSSIFEHLNMMEKSCICI